MTPRSGAARGAARGWTLSRRHARLPAISPRWPRLAVRACGATRRGLSKDMGRGSAGQGDPAGALAGGSKPTIAVFNSSADTVDLLRTALEAEGFQTVVGHIPDVKKGELDLVGFINHHAPAVVVYDISPPYDANWRFLRLVRSAEPLQRREFVLTTTNKPALDRLVGDTEALEIIGKPYDLRRVIDAVRAALARVA